MLDISKAHLALLVSAVNDAVKYNEGFLSSETLTDVSDHEEHLSSLENLQQWLETEYRGLQSQHPDLLTYERVVGQSGKDRQA
jgi:hypothetical protein